MCIRIRISYPIILYSSSFLYLHPHAAREVAIYCKSFGPRLAAETFNKLNPYGSFVKTVCPVGGGGGRGRAATATQKEIVCCSFTYTPSLEQYLALLTVVVVCYYYYYILAIKVLPYSIMSLLRIDVRLRADSEGGN